MPSWSDIQDEVPELSARARAFFDEHTHKTLATLRRDGSPRISGTECLFVEDELWFGSMWRAMKALDLQRDPRFALHSGSADQERWTGDAKAAGTVEEITDPVRIKAIVTQAPPGKLHLFRADITELVVVSLNASKTKMVVESWHPGRGTSRAER